LCLKIIFYDFNINKTEIHSYDEIYLAIDDKNVINFFKGKNLAISNFTTFPQDKVKNLHFLNIDPHIKIQDLFCDIYLLAMSEKIISNSKGGFIKLVLECQNHVKDIYEQFQ